MVANVQRGSPSLIVALDNRHLNSAADEFWEDSVDAYNKLTSIYIGFGIYK